MRLALLAIVSVSEGVFLPLFAIHKAQCFLTKQVENSHIISASYEISGTTDEVLVTLHHPATEAPVWTSRQLADHFKYTATAPGQYNLCFKQTSTRSRQTVSFQLHVSGDSDFYEDISSNLASSSQMDKVSLFAGQLERKVHDLVDQQDYAITREAIHRDTAESTNSRVLWWSLGQVGMVVTMSLVQMYFIRRFFEVKLIV